MSTGQGPLEHQATYGNAYALVGSQCKSEALVVLFFICVDRVDDSSLPVGNSVEWLTQILSFVMTTYSNVTTY